MKKLLPVILLTALVCGMFTSCNGGASGGTDTKTESMTENAGSDIERIDLGGYEIRFLARGEGSGGFTCIDLYAEGMNGDRINDAVYERNSYLEETYNFKLRMTGVSVSVSGYAESPATIARTSVLAQEDVYDVVYDSMNQTAPLLQEKMLVDLYTLPHVDFSKPYWDQSVNKDVSIGGKLYTTHGEHMLSVRAGLYSTFFNKQIADDLGLGDLYAIVRNNKWTVEKYYGLAKDVAADLNGDGKLGLEDLWGLTSESFNALVFFEGAGEKITAKDNNDLPMLALNTPRAESVLALSSAFLTDKNSAILFDNYSSDKWPLLTKIWEEGRSLFFLGPLTQTPDFRNMAPDFGILPAPKYEESQERYYHIVSIWNASLLVVPVTVTHRDEIGYILELLAAKSADTLTPAFYDIQLTTKVIRDVDSKEMIDIILSSATFDLGASYDFGGLVRQVVLKIGASGGNFASSYAANESAAQKAIDEFTEAVK